MTMEDLKSKIPDYAKDIKINLSSLLNRDNFPGLTDVQHFGSVLASAISVGSKDLKELVLKEGREVLKDADIRAAHSAASIMAMNNVYYKSIGLMGDSEVGQMPARLRMTVIGSPGVEKVDFELYCVAVSAINGCGPCLKSHAQELVKHGVAKEALHSVIRIASIVNSANFALQEI